MPGQVHEQIKSKSLQEPWSCEGHDGKALGLIIASKGNLSKHQKDRASLNSEGIAIFLRRKASGISLDDLFGMLSGWERLILFYSILYGQQSQFLDVNAL